MDGIILDVGGLSFTPEYDEDDGCVHVCATQNMGELQSFLADIGRELPPDPTSAPDCTLGGAVATNASGASSFKYGSIKNFVDGLSVVDGRGTARTYNRRRVEKCAMGPVGVQNPMDWFVGSEGLFGVLVSIGLRTIPLQRHRMGVFVGFPGVGQLIQAVLRLRSLRAQEGIRAMEWLDEACCRMLSERDLRIRIPEGPGGGLYVEVEAQRREEAWDSVERVVDELTVFGVRPEDSQVFDGASEIAGFSEVRHSIPDTMNRRGFDARASAGGGKLSTDWSVPLEHLESLFQWTRTETRDLGLDGLYAYGHIGNGHPHMNLLCPDSKTRERAYAVLKCQMERVRGVGGVATSEHGIGKLKRDLVRPFLDDSFLSVMRALKSHFDPAGILAVGNILGE
jgi:FAD/FMN-containing dehydrogenase